MKPPSKVKQLEALKIDFPILAIISDAEFATEINSGGLVRAMTKARIRSMCNPTPRGRGRPKTEPKIMPLFHKRGRKSEQPLVNGRTNIMIADLARVYRDGLKCTAAKAAEATLITLTGNCTKQEKRRLAKLVTESDSRLSDKLVTSTTAESRQPDLTMWGGLKTR